MNTKLLNKLEELRINDKIECVNDKFRDEETNPFFISDLSLPKKRKIYTIREIVETDYGIGLRLKEIKNREYWFADVRRYEEPIFSIEKFKKVD